MHDPIVTGQHVDGDKLDSARQLRRAQTSAENVLWQRLRRSQLQGLHFRRQQVISGYVADFYCHAARLVIEVDGAVHETRIDEDAFRDAVLHSHGLTVLRVSNEEVRTNIDAVLNRIVALAGAR
jgi:very-short-patch-repair endonuclease